MPILSGPLNVIRYRVQRIDALPTMTALVDQLGHHAFRPSQDIHSGACWGWCSAHNLLDCDFADINQAAYDRYLLFAIRRERRRLPAALFKAHLQRRIEAWCKEHGRQRCPVSVRADIKETLEVELLSKVLPESKSWGACWNTDLRELIIEKCAEDVQERFVKLFFETFGLRLAKITALDLVQDRGVLAGLLSTGGLRYEIGAVGFDTPDPDCTPLEEEGDDAYESPTMPHLAYEFMLWIWWLTIEHDCKFELGDLGLVDLWCDGRITLAEPSSDNKTVVVTSSTPTNAPEALEALRNGLLPTEITLSWRRYDRESRATLMAPDVAMRGVRLPQVVAENDEEALYDRMFLWEEACAVIGALFRAFAERRVHGWTRTGDGRSIKRWIAESDDAFADDGEE